MPKETRVLDESAAIELAKEHLGRICPNVIRECESEINAERIAGAKREQKRKDLVEFAAAHGGASEELPFSRWGLDEDHWFVRFFKRYPEGSAGTMPPTFVRVYETEHRVEMDY